MIVVGGGPAGLVAAARLAAMRHRVVLLEEHDAIGTPVHCTGVLALEAVDALDLPRAALLNPLTTVRLIAPSGRSFAHVTSQREAVVIDRLVFDNTLAERAQNAGVDVRRACRVQRLDVHPAMVVAALDDGRELRARAVILACGANYGMQRKFGLGMPATFLQSAQIELPAAHPGDVEIHFGSFIAPKGFAWTVPVHRREGTFARVGVMAERDAGVYFERVIERVSGRWGLHVPAELAPRRRMLPLGAIRRTYADRVLAVGDAAGLVKPTTGGGIYYSVVSGMLAAEVLGAALDRDALGADALGEYERRWRARFQGEFTAQLALRIVAERMSDEDIDELFELARTDGILPLVRHTARFNRHREFIVALFRHTEARRLLLRRVAPAAVS